MLYRLPRLGPILLLALLVSLAPAARAGQPPNIVIIILDDWGWQESGAYGNPRIQTPRIDQLARNGAQFHNAFLTASTCSSSRASILSGQYPFAVGVPRLHVPLPPDKKLLSQHLRQAGYFTASVGKWHLGETAKSQFDRVIEERQTADESQSGAEDWLQALEQLPAGRPFFLWLAAKDPHKPWLDDPAWQVHRPEQMQIPPYTQLNKKQDPTQFRQDVARYYDEIHRADVHIGQVVDALREKQQLDNTILIVMSDNGAPFWKAKMFLTDAGLKTPFIVHWPAHIRQHRDVRELVSAVDIAPTLLQAAGLPIPKEMEGVSFAHWLSGPATTPIRDRVYGERGDELLGSRNGRSLRDQHYLYIKDDYDTYSRCSDPLWQDPLRGEQLYDVTDDPWQQHNLAQAQPVLTRWWRKLQGKDDEAALMHYRTQLQARRKQRHDLPAPVINGDCPVAWMPK